MKRYAWVDELGLPSGCLSDDFVIMIDDAERSGETRTIVEMERVLREHQVAYRKGVYRGRKDCVLFCTERF